MSAEDCFARLAESFARTHPQDAARDLASLPGQDVVDFLGGAPEVSAVLLSSMSAPAATHYLEHLAPPTAAAVLEHADPDQVAHLLHPLAESGRAAILSNLPDVLAGQIRDRLSYPARSVGAIMRIRPPSVPADATIGGAIEHLRRQRSGGIPYAYVVDGRHHLTGVLSLMALMHASSTDPVGDHMVAAQTRLTASVPISAVIDHAGWRRFPVLPVVDADERLVGALEYRSLLHHWSPEDTSTTDSAGAALGELYHLGVSGMLQMAARGAPLGEQIAPRGEGER